MQMNQVMQESGDSLEIIPGFAEDIHECAGENWRETLSNFFMVDTALPAKTKVLLGLASAATMRCRY